MIKKTLVDSVAVPMLTQRQPVFKTLPKYQNDRSLDEPVKTVYITSARYANEWYNTMYNKAFVAFFKDKRNKYRVFDTDIFLAVKYGLKSLNWLISQKNTMTDMNYRMELLNEVLGEAENAFFSLEQFQRNQIVKDCFILPTIQQFLDGTIKNRKKGKNEVRLVFMDIAFTSHTKKTDSDNTVIGCMAIVEKDGKWYRKLEYLETFDGVKVEETKMTVRLLYNLYQADYIVYDHRNGGTLYFHEMTKPISLGETEYPTGMIGENGFTICGNYSIQMMSSANLDSLKAQTVDASAIPCLIPIAASSEWNSNMWQDLSLRLKNGEIILPIDDIDFVASFEMQKDYLFMTSEEKAQQIISHKQTSLLINEAVNLTPTWSSGLVKLTEPRTGYKDRIVALAYANAIATKIINDLEKNLVSYKEIDFDDLQLIF